MKIKKGKLVITALIGISIVCIGVNGYAHSGKTDKYGGHKDNGNKSGLGSYHYHCGGHEAHLHPNGVCPYSTSSKSQSTSNKSTATPKESSTIKTQTTTQKKSSSNEITVKPNPIIATEVKINEAIEKMQMGESKDLTVLILPENTEDRTVIWKSSDKSVIFVDNLGKITAKKAGKAEITVSTSNGKSNSIEIEVEEERKQEDNTINKIQENQSRNDTIKEEEQKESSNVVPGIIGIGALGGGYLAYKKYKK